MRTCTLSHGALVLFVALFSGCGDDGATNELALDAQGLDDELTTGTTSECVTNADGATVRVDKVSILAGDNDSSLDRVIVSRGAKQVPQRGGQLAFVEATGSYESDGSGSQLVFVGPRGVATLDGGGGSIVYVLQGGTLNCGEVNESNSIYYQSGALLVNCAGQGSQNLVSDTLSFSRCAANTVTTHVYPTPSTTVTRTGSVLTVTNHTTGNFSGARWVVGVMSSMSESAILFRSTARNGFTYVFPSDIDTKYPAAGFFPQYYVDLTITTPLGDTITSRSFL